MITKKRNNINIRRKVLVILCIVLSLTVVGNFVIGGSIFKKAQISAFNQEAFSTSRGLQTSINNLIEKSYLPYTEIVNCQPLLEKFTETNEKVLYVYTTDLEGNVLYSSEDAMIEDEPKENIKKAISSGEEEKIEDAHSNKLYYILPLQEKKIVGDKDIVEQVGSMVVTYPRSCITDPVNKLYRYNGILSAITFLVSVLLTFFWLTKWITKPLQKLDVAIHNVFNKGVVNAELVDINSGDEIGQIANSFNSMLVKLDVTTVSKDYINSIIVNMSEALFVIDKNKRIEIANDAAVELLGYKREDIVDQLIDFLFVKMEDNPFCNDQIINIIEYEELKNTEIEFATKNGKNVFVSVNWSTIKDADGTINKYVCTARDITEVKKAQKIMLYQANYDELTGLSNRYNLEQSIEKILKDHDKKHVFLMLDLDKFKIVNDMCGHTAGDKLLKQIAFMLQTVVGENDLVARVGGDEFAIIMYDTDINEAKRVMEGLLKDIRNFNFTWENKVFNIGISIGAFELNRQGLDRLSVVNAADRACYIAKEKGGDRLHIYNDEELIERKEEANIMTIITDAFENNRFFLEYQPIVSLKSDDETRIFEALVRIKCKDGRVIEPGAFLSAAQRYNLLVQLDQWVIHNFCENYHKDIEKLCYGSLVQFNINLTGASLNSEHFYEFICHEFQKYRIPPRIMCFEVTESCAVSNYLDATTLIKKLRNMGCKFALDDFGMGMSSFMYLKFLPVDSIKIDGAFVKEIVKSPIDTAVVRSINEIAHLLNIKTVAEHVETKEILEIIKELGVDYVQGYEVMRPGKFENVVKK